MSEKFIEMLKESIDAERETPQDDLLQQWMDEVGAYVEREILSQSEATDVLDYIKGETISA